MEEETIPNGTSPHYGGTEDSSQSDASHDAAEGLLAALEQSRSERRRIIRNIVVVAAADFLLLSCFHGVAILQSSINSSGSNSLAAIYGAIIVSSLLVSTWTVKRITVKWTLVLGALCYSSYLAAQFRPTVALLITTGIVMGLGAAPMWSAISTYATQAGKRYAHLSGGDEQVLVAQVFGFMFAFFQFSYCAGSLVSSSVLSAHVTASVAPPTGEELCGTDYCPTGGALNSSSGNRTAVTSTPSLEADIITLTSIFFALSLVSAAVLAFFLDPLSRFDEREEAAEPKTMLESLRGTLRLMVDTRQVLLMPITMWAGIEHGYLVADYAAAYVRCGLGIHMIGYVFISFGVCNFIFALCCGHCVKAVGRIPVFTTAALINGLAVALMFVWSADTSKTTLLFVIPGMWGMSDAVWQSQLRALYGIVFPSVPEAAFSNLVVIEATGFCINYILQPLLCNTSKVVIMVVLLTVGMVGYYLLEVKLKRDSSLAEDLNPIIDKEGDINLTSLS